MAYGTEAEVLYFLTLSAVDTDYFTSANITIAITHADLEVDQINSNADSVTKTQASAMLAAGELIVNKSLADNNYNSSLSQTNGQPATVPISKNPYYDRAEQLLRRQNKRFYRNAYTSIDKSHYYDEESDY